MPDLKISELAAISSVGYAAAFPVTQAGDTKRASLIQLLAPLRVETIAALRNREKPTSATLCIVEGSTVAGDGGGGDYYWDPNSSASDDGITVVAPTAGGVGRWRRLPPAFAAGSLSAPGISVAGDRDTGLAQLDGADTLAVVVGGQKRIGIDEPGERGIRIRGGGQADVWFEDTDAGGAAGDWRVHAQDFFDQGGHGVHNHTWGIHYNEDGAAVGFPRWGENWEPRYVPGAPPNGLLEKNWDYTSINGAVSYRPFNFSVDLNTNVAALTLIHGRLEVVGVGQSVGGEDTLSVSTANKALSTAGHLSVGAVTTGAGDSRLKITGAPIGTVMQRIAPTALVHGDSLVFVSTPAVTGDVFLLGSNISATGRVESQIHNPTGGVVTFLRSAGSAGDAWVRALAASDWSFGVRRSDGAFVVANGDTLAGGGEKFSVTSASALKLAATQVLTTRRTGWGAPSGTATRTTFATGSVTLPQLAERVKALIDDLTTHGLVGA